MCMFGLWYVLNVRFNPLKIGNIFQERQWLQKLNDIKSLKNNINRNLKG